MDYETLQEIMECLPKERNKFYYFKDRYALMLLSYLIGKGRTIREIKKSRFCGLLQKTIVQKIMGKTGGGTLTPHEIGSLWPDQFHCYLLTIGQWGNRKGWSQYTNQTSRPGWNLVLQLNFSTEHNHYYQRLIKPTEIHPFHCNDHPIATNGQHTLAWARIDLDFDKDEALIEEIQTDWIRLALRSKRLMVMYQNRAKPRPRYLPRCVKGLGCDTATLINYIDRVLTPHIGLWQEAMLASAISFLKEEIGISQIFYHTYDFGCQLKSITGRKPPRSLYTQLPKSFCFEKTEQVPGFLLANNRRKMRNLLKRENSQFFQLKF